jgi:ribosomal-protein-alanine acetyltransferase
VGANPTVRTKMFEIKSLEREEELEGILEVQEKCFENLQRFSKKFLFNLWRYFPEGFVIAKNKEKVLGYGILKKEIDKGLIFSLGVLPEMQNQGIGKEIMKRLIEIAKKENLKKIYLHTKETNFKAIAFYQKFGFNIIKLKENYYSTGENAYLMELEIEK